MPRREATLLTAATEVRGKAVEKRCMWNWLKWASKQSGKIRHESSCSRLEVNIGDTEASSNLKFNCVLFFAVFGILKN